MKVQIKIIMKIKLRTMNEIQNHYQNVDEIKNQNKYENDNETYMIMEMKM